jgi:predicted aspartyl protease
MRSTTTAHALLVVVSFGGALLACGCGEKGFDYGPWRIKVEDLTRRADKTPCDPVAAKELMAALVEAGDLATAGARAKAFRAACKPDQSLAEKELDVARRAQDKPGAIEAAQVLVDLSPSHAKRRADLAKALDEGGDPAKAVLEWRRAFALAPADPGTADGLATVQEKAGQACEALISWRRFAAFRPDKAADATPHVEALAAKPGCAATKPTGTSTLTQKSIGGWFVFPVKLGGKDAELGVDFSSGHTTISKALADKIGVKTEGALELTAKTFAGTVVGKLVTIPTLELGGMKVEPVEALVVDKLPNDVMGMLGADVTSRIEMNRASPTTWSFTPR